MKQTIMPNFSEEMMLEFSETITPKFSKVRFASLHTEQTDERIDQHTERSITGGEDQDVRIPQEHLENGKHNGNGHHVVAEIEELEVLDPQQPDESVEHNGYGLDITAELLEETAPRLPKIHVAPPENVQPAEQGEHSEQQATGKLALRGFLDSRKAGEQVQRNEHHTTAELEQPTVFDSQGPSEREERSQHHATAELDPQRPGKRVQRNMHIPPRAHPPNSGTEKLSAPVRSFNQVRLASLVTPTTKHIDVAPAPHRPVVRPATVIPPRVQDQERVKFYAAWLDKQAQHDRRHDSANEIDDYIQEAAKIVKVGKHEVAIFAPFRPKLSALQTFTTGQVIAFALIGLLCIAGVLVFRLEFLASVIGVVTILYFLNLLINFSQATRAFRDTPEEHISDAIVNALKDAEWPEYTILCPLYKEARVVAQFAQAMTALDYPAEKLQILFLTEEDDTATRNAIRALSLPPHFKIVVVPDGKPRTKPRACNYGLMLAKGQYVVIYDAEDIPDPLQLKKAVLAFANHGTDVVC